MAHRRSLIPSIIADYTVQRIISSSPTGYVVKAIHTHHKVPVIIKIVNEPKELEVLSTLCHPNIVNFIEAFQRGKQYFIVMEYVEGGDLWDFITSNGKLSEEEARKLFKQLVEVIDYLHVDQILCHRDLKLENILLTSDNNIRLCDFGFCAPISSDSTHTEWLGSPEYCSPEIVNMIPYAGSEVDIWALGVLLFEMLTGEPPFIKFEFKEPTKLQYMSTNCRDLLQKMLFPNREERITIEKIKSHPWLLSS